MVLELRACSDDVFDADDYDAGDDVVVVDGDDGDDDDDSCVADCDD